MWNPGRISRTPSMQSMSRSLTSSSSSSYEGSINGEQFPLQIDMWRTPGKMEPVVQEVELDARSRRDSVSTTHSHSTLAVDLPEEEMDPKTPKAIDSYSSTVSDQPVGPLEHMLLSLLSKVTPIERDQPTVMAEDYQQLQATVSELKSEKQTWSRRHEALFALRDEDVSNLINLRTLLAAERREHAAMRKLRDDDVHNVVELRDKLAHATWAKPASERGQAAKLAARQSRPEGSDLWQAAKTAAMEQRVLELERANKELRDQLELGAASQKPKERPLAKEISHGAVGTALVETMLEDSLRYREKMATKVQQLRWEKEAFQKESERLEDRNSELETTIQKLQRRIGALEV